MQAAPKYDHEQIERLFSTSPLAEETYGLYFTSGFILSVASAPDMIQVSEWLPVVFKSGRLPEFESREQLEAVNAGLLSIWSFWVDQVADDELRLTLQPGCVMDSEQTPSRALIDFCSGYLQGRGWLEETWDRALEGMPENAEEDSILGGCLLVCMMIADQDRFREEFAEDTGRFLPGSMADAYAMLPYMLKESAQTGWRLFRAIMQAKSPVRAKTEKIGRNAPCPCGSGRKYKNCCLNKQEA